MISNDEVQMQKRRNVTHVQQNSVETNSSEKDQALIMLVVL